MRSKNHIIIPDDPPKGPPIIIDILLLFVAPPISTIVGLYFLFKRGKYELKRRQNRDYRRYAAIIADRSSVSIRELASRLGKAPGEVADDLQSMINSGIIDERAYIDRATMTLYMSDSVIETEFVSYAEDASDRRRAQEGASRPIEIRFVEARAEQKPRASEAAHAAPAEGASPARPERRPAETRRTDVGNDDFESKLREIRKLNDDIENELVSQRIDRIGTLTASIFRAVREKPERADEVRKFMNYYLPTTLKLLKSYSLMEKQSYQGENIQASRKKIEDVLGSLVHAFEQQQDRLFQSEALDVETDISVLETMMASDGLTERGGLHL